MPTEIASAGSCYRQSGLSERPPGAADGMRQPPAAPIVPNTLYFQGHWPLLRSRGEYRGKRELRKCDWIPQIGVPHLMLSSRTAVNIR
jgi:hypothetical protein